MAPKPLPETNKSAQHSPVTIPLLASLYGLCAVLLPNCIPKNCNPDQIYLGPSTRFTKRNKILKSRFPVKALLSLVHILVYITIMPTMSGRARRYHVIQFCILGISYHRPECPNPPLPRGVADRNSTGRKRAWVAGIKSNCAIRSPRSIVCFWGDVLSKETITSPR